MRNHVLSIKLISCFQKHTVAENEIVALGPDRLANTIGLLLMQPE